jgi:hypothetical protein
VVDGIILFTLPHYNEFHISVKLIFKDLPKLSQSKFTKKVKKREHADSYGSLHTAAWAAKFPVAVGAFGRVYFVETLSIIRAEPAG